MRRCLYCLIRFLVPDRGCRPAICVALVLAPVLLLCGCHLRSDSRVPRPLAAPPAPAMPDLSRSFNPTLLLTSSDRQPLTLVEKLAQVAGGAWIALAPKPLDDVRWDPEAMMSTSSLSVEQVLNTIRKKGTPVWWERREGYLLVFFGPQADFKTIRTRPSDQMTGVLLAAPSPEMLTRAAAGYWHLNIHASPKVLQAWTSLLLMRNADLKSQPPRNMLFQMMEAGRGRYGRSGEKPPVYPEMLHLKIIDRLDTEDLIRRLGSYLGGRASEKNGVWEIDPLSDAAATEEAQQLMAQIEQNPGANASTFTSFASRSGEDTGDEDEGPPTIPPVNEEIRGALDHLELLGKAGAPVLTGFLDPDRPSLAEGAVRVLAEMDLQECSRALQQFYPKLAAATAGRAADRKNALRGALRKNLLEILARAPTRSNIAFLSGLMKDESVPVETRMNLRLSLLRAGIIEPLIQVPHDEEGKSWSSPEMEFQLRPPPGGGAPSAIGPIPPGTILPLATTTLANGEVWGVFVSPRFGDANDLWLARGKPGRWEEFLFTGRQYRSYKSTEYSESTGSAAPRPGACTLRIQGDRVTMAPVDPAAQAEVIRLEKALERSSDRGQTRKLYEEYDQATRRTSGHLGVTIHLSLADLRRDTDHDGLPQLVEARLGTWQTRRDTDFDGVPDGLDQNPLAAPAKRPPDRVTILQILFRALYGGDPAPDPIFVVLPHPYWQEFKGARARVLCITPEEFLKRAPHLAALRFLQFGGPLESSDTILKRDGPCLFSDDGSRAEVHFWEWAKIPTDLGYGSDSSSSSADDTLPVDYLAEFKRSGSWRLVSVRPWKSGDAVQSALALMDRIQSGGGMPMDEY